MFFLFFMISFVKHTITFGRNMTSEQKYTGILLYKIFFCNHSSYNNQKKKKKEFLYYLS